MKKAGVGVAAILMLGCGAGGVYDSNGERLPVGTAPAGTLVLPIEEGGLVRSLVYGVDGSYMALVDEGDEPRVVVGHIDGREARVVCDSLGVDPASIPPIIIGGPGPGERCEGVTLPSDSLRLDPLEGNTVAMRLDGDQLTAVSGRTRYRCDLSTRTSTDETLPGLGGTTFLREDGIDSFNLRQGVLLPGATEQQVTLNYATHRFEGDSTNHAETWTAALSVDLSVHRIDATTYVVADSLFDTETLTRTPLVDQDVTVNRVEAGQEHVYYEVEGAGYLWNPSTDARYGPIRRIDTLNGGSTMIMADGLAALLPFDSDRMRFVDLTTGSETVVNRSSGLPAFTPSRHRVGVNTPAIPDNHVVTIASQPFEPDGLGSPGGSADVDLGLRHGANHRLPPNYDDVFVSARGRCVASGTGGTATLQGYSYGTVVFAFDCANGANYTYVTRARDVSLQVYERGAWASPRVGARQDGDMLMVIGEIESPECDTGSAFSLYDVNQWDEVTPLAHGANGYWPRGDSLRTPFLYDGDGGLRLTAGH